MIFYIIPLIIIVLSVLYILFLLGKKLPNIASINVESIAKENQSIVRNKIMLDRINRKFLKAKKASQDLVSPLRASVKDFSKNLHQKAVEMERETLKKSQPLKKIDLVQGIEEKVEAIKKYMADQNFESAEQECISILEINNDNLDAYELLTEVYVETKDYKKARETSRYLLKLLTKKTKGADDSNHRHRLANAYADLGEIYELEGRNSYSLSNYKKAVDLEPNNPRFLDLLLKISIILKDKDLAIEAFNNLENSDPDNQKLPELKAEIDNLT